jgi:hypothetical protein
MKKLITEKEAENNELFAHLQEMEVSVSERQKIYEIQAQNTASIGNIQKLSSLNSYQVNQIK